MDIAWIGAAAVFFAASFGVVHLFDRLRGGE